MSITKKEIRSIRILLTATLGLCITACGNRADAEHKIPAEAVSTSVNEIQEDIAACGSGVQEYEAAYEDGIQAHGTASENGMQRNRIQGNVAEQGISVGEAFACGQPENSVGNPPFIKAYLTEDIEYCEDAVPVQYTDELSLMEDLKYADQTYVYQDGMIYYRKYHDDSFTERALWGAYDFVSGVKTEIVCMGSNGKVTELFADEGYGDIYLINDRFYMTDTDPGAEQPVEFGIGHLYSTDMQGNDRIDYGSGRILIADRERNIVILQMQEQRELHYYVMDCVTGTRKLLAFPDDEYYITLKGYRDGVIYYSKSKKNGNHVRILCTVSLENEHREILAITTNPDDMPWASDYHESILHLESDGERIYFVFGGYGGSAAMFQGGKLVSIKPDGTNYKAIEIDDEDYYLCHENGRTLVYFSNSHSPIADERGEYNALVWDVEADRCYPSDFPLYILYAHRSKTQGLPCVYSGNQGSLCIVYQNNYRAADVVDIYAIPDDSGRIVRAAMDLKQSFVGKDNTEQGYSWIKDPYYADGYLYFTAEYSVYDEKASIGWRDGYRRLKSEVYRLAIEEDTAQLLYSY